MAFDFLMEPWRYPFMVRASVLLFFLAPISAAVGVFLQQRSLAFFSDGLAHVGFGALAVAVALGFTMDHALGVALPVAMLAALVLARSSLRGKIPEDTALAVLLTTSLALGLAMVKVFAAPGSGAQVEHLLFGSLLSAAPVDVKWVVAVSVLVGLFLWRFKGQLAMSGFFRDLAALHSSRVELAEYLFLCSAGVLVVVAIKAVGVLLVSGLFVLPAATARLWSDTVAKTVFIAMLVATVAAYVGLFASFYGDIPTGAGIVLAQTLFLLVSYFCRVVRS